MAVVLESAAEFGLASSELIAAVAVALDRLPEGVRERCTDEISAELAACILEKQRNPRVA
jgi:hypothetical protein